MEMYIIFGMWHLLLITVLLWFYFLALVFKIQDFWRDPVEDQEPASHTPSELSCTNMVMADRPNILR